MLEEITDCYNNKKLISKDFIEYFIFYYADLLWLKQVVITSYSIHYTKLYDLLTIFS